MIPVVSEEDRGRAYVYIILDEVYQSLKRVHTRFKSHIKYLRGESRGKPIKKRTLTPRYAQAIYDNLTLLLNQMSKYSLIDELLNKAKNEITNTIYKLGLESTTTELVVGKVEHIFTNLRRSLREVVKSLNIRREIEEVVEEFINKYIPAYYLSFTKLIPNKAILAIIAEPPQITFPEFSRLLTPDSYININFIPVKLRTGKCHKNIVNKFFFSTVKIFWKTRFTKLISQYPVLKALFNKIMTKYEMRGRSREVAFKLAQRDIVRVIIGNTWLVTTFALYRQNYIKNLVIPKHIINHAIENNLTDLINPSQIVDESRLDVFLQKTNIDLREVTWEWLVDEYSKQVGKKINIKS